MGVSSFIVRAVTQRSIVALIERVGRANALSQSNVAVSKVALTFDDGPHPDWTPRVLDTLDRALLKATFFVVGRCVAKYPQLVLEARDRGHEIGTHLYSHDRRVAFDDRVFSDEVRRCKDQLETLLGESIRWLRFPYGQRGLQHPRSIKKSFGLDVVHWTYSSLDSKLGNPEDIVLRVKAGLRSGVIILMHDALADEEKICSPYIPARAATLAALPEIGECLARRRLGAVTLSELFDKDQKHAII